MENPFDYLDDTSIQLDTKFIAIFEKIFAAEFNVNMYGIRNIDVHRMAKIANNGIRLNAKRLSDVDIIVTEYKVHAQQHYYNQLALAC